MVSLVSALPVHLGALALRATVLLLAGLVIALGLRGAAAAARRAVWAATLSLLLVLPLATAVLPATELRIFPPPAATMAMPPPGGPVAFFPDRGASGPPAPARREAVSSKPAPAGSIPLGLWLVGAGAMLFRDRKSTRL